MGGSGSRGDGRAAPGGCRAQIAGHSRRVSPCFVLGTRLESLAGSVAVEPNKDLFRLLCCQRAVKGGLTSLAPVWRLVALFSITTVLARTGAVVAATLYTLVETATLHHVNPMQYPLEAVRAADRGEVLLP